MFHARGVPSWLHGTRFQLSQMSILFTLMLAFVATASIVVSICKIRDLGEPFSSIGWNLNKDVWVSVPLGLGVAATTTVALFLTFGGVAQFRDGFAPVSILLFLMTSVVGQPLIEEFYFRGVLFVALSARFSQFTTVMLTSILFALFHVGGYRIIAAFVLLGVVLGFTRIKTRSVAACFALHASYNLGVLVTQLLSHYWH